MESAIERIKAHADALKSVPHNAQFRADLVIVCDALDARIKEQPRYDAALRTITGMGYYWDGGAYYRAPSSNRMTKDN